MASHDIPESGSGAGDEPDGTADKTMIAQEQRSPLRPDSGPHHTVGAELRMRREELRRTIRDVADIVRIQARYLEAIEDDRIGDLPGRVYALGFVRTYAEYLGLDGNEMVERFKEESKGLVRQAHLTMPEPIDEGKVPTAAIIVAAIVLAGVAYSAWYFMFGADTRVAEVVPEVPERLANLVPPELDTPGQPAATAAPEQPSTAQVTVSPPATPAAPESSAAGAAPAAAPAPQQQAATAPITAAPAPATPPVVATPAPAPTPPQPTPQAAPAPAATPSPPDEETTAAAAAPAIPPLPAATGTREPVVYGLDNPGARVVITALEDSWVEVKDADGALIFTRVLRKGDSYQAPESPGATFMTGNAGGLRIDVDGRAAPPLGPAGAVRRDVKLDPQLLLEGRAWR